MSLVPKRIISRNLSGQNKNPFLQQNTPFSVIHNAHGVWKQINEMSLWKIWNEGLDSTPTTDSLNDLQHIYRAISFKEKSCCFKRTPR